MSSKIALKYLSEHPTDAAIILQQFDLDKIINFLSMIKNESTIINCLTKFSPSIAAACISELDKSIIVRFFTELSLNICVPVFRQFTLEQQAKIIPNLPKIKVNLLRYYLEFPHDSIGAIMKPKEFSFNVEQKVKDVIEIIKKHALYNLPVLLIEDHQQKLLGSVEMQQLVIVKNNTRLEQLLDKNIVKHTLLATAKQIDLLHSPHWNDYDTLPVIDNRKALVGHLSFRSLYQFVAGIGRSKQAVTILDDILSLVAYYSEMHSH